MSAGTTRSIAGDRQLRRPGQGVQRADLPQQPRPLRRGDRRPEQHGRRRARRRPTSPTPLGRVVPGTATSRNAFASATGRARRYVASNSGPSIYEDPAIIHPPNSPLGHTDEMYSLHPGGANVLLGDGSVRFIKAVDQSADLGGAEQPCGGEVISSDY